MATPLAVLLLASVFSSVDGRVVGSIQTIEGNEIRLRSGGETLTIYAGKTTELRKGRVYRDLSPLKPGSEISIRCDKDPEGKLVALNIFADVLTFTGVIERVSAEEILVSTNRLGGRLVRIYPGTVLGAGADSLVEGEQVHIVGLDVGNRTVDATRIAIYNTDVPAHN